MNDKGNQKHLTFEQRVDIEKGLTENKSFAEIARMIGKDPSTVSKESDYTHIQRNVLMQDIPIHPASTAKNARLYAFVMNNAEHSVRFVKNLTCVVSMYVRAMKLQSAKSWINRPMSAMAVLKRLTALCQESFILPSMLTMNIAVFWSIAESVLIRLRRAFRL